MIARMAPCAAQGSGEGHLGLCRGTEATWRGTPVFVGDAQLIKQSPVLGGGWSGLGGLAHSSCQFSSSCPPPTHSGDGRRVEREIMRAEGQSLLQFIAGELEICLSPPVWGDGPLRSPQRRK